LPRYLWLRRFIKSEIAFFLSAIALLYLCLTGLSHLAYNVQDEAGLVCRERDPKALAPGESKEVSFMLSGMCNTTGILLEEGVKYCFRIVAKTLWRVGTRTRTRTDFTPQKRRRVGAA
jgi:hypothetical protein